MARGQTLSMDIENLDEVIRDLRKVKDKTLRKELRKADKAAAHAVKNATKPPKRSGDLERSIRVKTTRYGAGVEAGVPYAGVIHWGWPKRNIKPNKFFTRALRAAQDRVREIYDDSLEVIRQALSS